MVRTKGARRKTTKGDFLAEVMAKAVQDVLENQLSCRKAAKKYNLAFKTVARCVYMSFDTLIAL